jgi:hypothetical protein
MSQRIRGGIVEWRGLITIAIDLKPELPIGRFIPDEYVVRGENLCVLLQGPPPQTRSELPELCVFAADIYHQHFSEQIESD